ELIVSSYFMAPNNLVLCQKLWQAAYNGDNEEVTKCLDDGADINWPNQNWSGFTPLMAASREGKTETVKLLLDRGADINRITDYTIVKNSALMIAVFWGHDATAELLLERGADVNFKTTQG
ncbi:unnamed protein product, partial [Meganyctiphanes norvegica]